MTAINKIKSIIFVVLSFGVAYSLCAVEISLLYILLFLFCCYCQFLLFSASSWESICEFTFLKFISNKMGVDLCDETD